MRYNVAQLLKEPVGSTRIYKVDEHPIAPDQGLHDKPKGHIRVTRTNKGILATVDLEAMSPNNCSRCLEHLVQPVHMFIEEEFLATAEMNTGNHMQLPEGVDGALFIDESAILDLNEVVRQYSITSVSMKPLCTPECLGLCPVCGGNRNCGDCSCAEVTSDPRWVQLKQFLELAK